MEKTKEVLHTQETKGEFVIERRNGKIFIEEYFKPLFYPDQDESTQVEVAKMHGNEQVDEDDAELICKAVNSYQSLIEENKKLKDVRNENQYVIDNLVMENKRLIDSNRELLAIVQKVNEWGKLKEGKFTYVNNNLEFKIELQTAINNAKNIQNKK